MSAAEHLDPILTAEELIRNYLDHGHRVQCQPGNPLYSSDVKVSQTQGVLKSPMVLLNGYTNPKIWSFSKLKEKNVVMDEMRAQLQGLNQSLVDESLASVDELITNAIFNAPFPTPVDRKLQELELPNGQKVQVGMGQDEKELSIVCADPFGTLDLKKFFEKILNCYVNGVGSSINYGIGGAGIGSYMVFEYATSLIVGVKAKQCTIVACKFPKAMGTKKRKTSPKNLIIFKEEA